MHAETAPVDDSIFDASSYQLPIPYKADRLSVNLGGTIHLDRTNEDDLALINSLEYGSRHTFTVDVVVVKAAPSLSPGKDDEPDSTTYTAHLKVESITPQP